MKIIDLLNKIANGEEAPEKFELLSNNEIFNYDNETGDYNGENGDYLFGEVITNVMNLQVFLNDEIEIIEEDKKLKKIKIEYSPDIEEKIFYEDGYKPNHCILGDAGTGLLINKINELIDKVNNMEKNK